MPEQPPDEAPVRKQPAADLLPAVYAELRRVAAALSGGLRPGQTLQPTALVHEAYLRLLRDRGPRRGGRRPLFGAAAPALRGVPIHQARPQATPQHPAAARRAARGG